MEDARQSALPPLKLEIVYGAGRWEVRDEAGELAGRKKVQRGQVVEWEVKETSTPGSTYANFFFPSVLFEHAAEIISVMAGVTFALQVSPDAPTGSYVYAVEIEGTYAVGGSPPELEVVPPKVAGDIGTPPEP